MIEQDSYQQILAPEIQDFIRANENADVQSLLLKHKTLFNLPASVIAEQISGRKKAKEKIPTFYNAVTVYPPGINLEQSSSEQTATFKAKIFLQTIPLCRSLIDLTGGFGVDSFFLSKIFKTVHYIEPNQTLFEIVKKNHSFLEAFNISHYNTTAEGFLSVEQNATAVLIDPSRRNENKKVFAFADCEPNVVQLQNKIFATTDYVLVKASPLIDLKLGVRELQFVKKIFVVAVDNEVKEVLFLCKKDFAGEATIDAVNLAKHQETFTFKFSDEEIIAGNFADPKTYLYEPNASILKAGAFKSIGKDFNLAKIQTNTHFYTSDSLVHEFPGRIFKVVSEVKPEKKSLMEFFPEGKANVLTRNYPLAVDELKKKTSLKDGGEKYLIGFSGQTKKFLIAAQRIK